MTTQIMDTKEAIVANASYHSRLLNTISSLEYVPAARKHQAEYVKDLEGQLAAGKKRVAALAEKTKKERKEHEDLRDSTARRLAAKLTGRREKWEEKESKEEREYVEALEREINERESQSSIEMLREEGKNVMIDLTEKETLYESAKAELQVLYSRIFDGPTQDFPEDDRLEYDLDAALKRYSELQARLNAESRAAELLARAARCMQSCSDNVQEALGYSRYDMWGGGSMADMMERNALSNARGNAAQAEMFVEQAKSFSPAIRPIRRVHIAEGSLLGDVLFDNIFTDIAFHTKIKESAAEVLQANKRLREEREAARRRADAVGYEVSEAARLLDTRRKELDHFRRATFESFVAQNPPPPDYDNIVAKPSNQPSGAPPAFPVPNVAPSAEGDAEMSTVPLTASPQPQAATSSTAGIGMLGVQMPEPEHQAQSQKPGLGWGSRNPFAAAIAEQTRKLSVD
ncbi:unnamed protein product [Cyclocybe aegerita]|uniref:Uncharacterized protein n=1 Tax=Cyclocybe aegerita TaxID=1973307 RepID=A0A8S0VY87_CYCAE|nr:unnamed protein product [Cyclocybe aegerita]